MSTTPHSQAGCSDRQLIGESPAIRLPQGSDCCARMPRLHSPSAGRNRHRQGTGGPVDSRGQRPGGRTFCAGSIAPPFRDSLLESQLFGHTRGAFSGADRATLGFFRAADSGTLFLDEIGELPLQSQAKLLRCIQERQVVPLGATSGIAADVRVIAATHRDLSALVRKGEFREDLFYRLNVATLRLPPLRERMEDIPLLVRHALDELGRLYRETPRILTEAAMTALMSHDWPGNVRELINAIEHALVFSAPDQALDVADLPEQVRADRPRVSVHDGAFSGLMTLEAAERQLIAAALRAHGGNQSRARAIAGDRAASSAPPHRAVRAYRSGSRFHPTDIEESRIGRARRPGSVARCIGRIRTTCSALFQPAITCLAVIR